MLAYCHEYLNVHVPYPVARIIFFCLMLHSDGSPSYA